MIACLATWQKQMGWRVFGDIKDQLMMARIHCSSQETL
jgi:hypothetical protein